jgi:hypothetical protein
MTPGLRRSLIYVLIAAQVLLSAPVVAAMSASAGATAAKMPCADSMTPAPDSQPCPCCTDGDTVAKCLSTCTAAVGMISSVKVLHLSFSFENAPAPHSVSLPVSADPPLKPPPIV